MKTTTLVVNDRLVVPGFVTTAPTIKGVGVGVRCRDAYHADRVQLAVQLHRGEVNLTQLTLLQAAAIVPGVTRAEVVAATRRNGNGHTDGNGIGAAAIAADLVAAAGGVDQAF